MITKKKMKGGKKISVTFRHEGHGDADTVEVLGDFNGWARGTHAMKRRKDGTWSLTVRLPRKQRFQFRYLVDDAEWTTDDAGDGLAPNEFGTVNAVLST